LDDAAQGVALLVASVALGLSALWLATRVPVLMPLVLTALAPAALLATRPGSYGALALGSSLAVLLGVELGHLGRRCAAAGGAASIGAATPAGALGELPRILALAALAGLVVFAAGFVRLGPAGAAALVGAFGLVAVALVIARPTGRADGEQRPL
jgi:hypothetical protein